MRALFPTPSFLLGVMAVLASPACSTSDSPLGVAEADLTSVSIVKDLRTVAGEDSSSSWPRQFVELGSKVYFVADQGVQSRHTWLFETDGTDAGTHGIVDLGERGYEWLVASNGRLFFTNGRTLWTSDGTAAGTAVLLDLTSPKFRENIHSLRATSFGVAFVGNDPITGKRSLYKSDGTTAGTTVLFTPPLAQGSKYPEFYLGNEIVSSGPFSLVVEGGKLVRTDGTPGGTHAIALPNDLRPQKATALPGGEFLVSTNDKPQGATLYRIDSKGQASEITPTAPIDSVISMTVVGTKVIVLTSRVSKRDLGFWVSDGTSAGTASVGYAAGTVPVANEEEGGSVSAQVGDKLYVVAGNGDLWSTDGTAAKTTKVGSLTAALGGRWVFEALASHAGRLVAVAKPSKKGSLPDSHLLFVDPTTATVALAPAAVRPRGPHGLTSTAAGLFYAGTDGAELCVSDATVAGTHLLKDLDIAGARSSNPEPLSPTQFGTTGSRAYFTANDGTHGRELWSTDGTAGGTAIVTDLTPGPDSTRFARGNRFAWGKGTTATLGDRFFFMTGTDTKETRDLYVTEGSSATTHKLATLFDADPHRTSSGIPAPLAHDGFLYFVTEGTDGHRDLFRTDGTVAGTTKVQEVLPVGSDLRQDTRLVGVNGGVVVFSESWSNEPFAAWLTDGTTAGTKPLDLSKRPFIQSNGRVAYFGKKDILRIDGVSTSPKIVKGTAPTDRAGIVGDALVFIAKTTLWRTDGTSIAKVKDLQRTPGLDVGIDVGTAEVDGSVALVDRDGITLTDGTELGTKELKIKVSNPHGAIGVAGKGVFFTLLTEDRSTRLSFWDGAKAPQELHSDFPFDIAPIPGGVLFQTGIIGNPARILVQSDGTTAGTKPVVGAPFLAGSATLLKGRVVFAATGPDGDRELWSAVP